MSDTPEPLDFSPPYLSPAYAVSIKRAPTRELIVLPRGWFHRIAGPAFGHTQVRPEDADLTNRGVAHPIGQRIHVFGRILDSDGRGVPKVLLELWQANAAGRYSDAAAPEFFPLDPNFVGVGRCLTANDGSYEFITIRPGAYSAGPRYLFRPAHLHVSLVGPTLGTRLVTQMYFPDDPLFAGDPMVTSVTDPRGRERLVGRFREARVMPDGRQSALHYEWNITLRGPAATPFEA